MATARTIPKGRPNAISLDFDRLRAEGITHLENLATEIWTDFNAGNPGITILEVLCYAITDLAYRTRITPIADLAAGDGQTKMFFLPEEILTCAPVTPNDFRKLLIDVPGVKNAWLEVAEVHGSKPHLQLYYQTEETSNNPLYHFPQYLIDKANASVDLTKEKAFILELLADYQGIMPKEEILINFVDYILKGNVPTSNEAEKPVIAAVKEYLDCTYQVVGLLFQKDAYEDPNLKWTPFPPQVPQGLYRITLDLDDEIGPIEAKKQSAALKAAWASLQANRGLCHDFESVQILDTEEIAVCLDLQLEEGVDEKLVLAEALFNLQDFLTPSIRFYSLAEMLGKRKPNGDKYQMDDIYNGPLLVNGFIDDAELDQNGIKPDPSLKFSDLYAILAPKEPGHRYHIHGLKAVNNISLRWIGGKEDNWSHWESGGMNDGTWRTGNPALSSETNFKYRIVPRESQFNIKKGSAGEPYSMNFSVFKEIYEQIVLERTCKFCMPQSTQSPPVKGRVRDDLATYKSIQYDFPGVYRVGANQWLEDAPNYKIGPMRELQSYLLFFDQILAAYLVRLGDTAKLLAVEQKPEEASYVLPPLFEVPGVQKMLAARAKVKVNDVDKGLLSVVLLDLVPFKVEQNIKTYEVADQKIYDDSIAILSDLVTSDQYTTISILLEKLEMIQAWPALISAVENYFWHKYIKDENNNFRQSLDAIAESGFQRQNRRNIILDHLLGRFGEKFSDFVSSLISADLNPEDNPGWFSFDDYLKDKAAYLLEVPGLGYHQSRGYNYRKLVAPTTQTDLTEEGFPKIFENVTTQMNNQPDVWNSTNVPGVKKRICYSLGLTELKDGRDEDGKNHYVWEATTLLSEPKYTIDLVLQTDRSRPQYYLALRKKSPPGYERLDRGDTLMESPRFPRKQQALDMRKELYKVIDQTGWYQLRKDDSDQSKWVVQLKQGDTELLFSDSGERILTDGRKKEILNLIEPRESRDYDGFHILEHILLRPNELSDKLLEIPLGGINPPDPYSNIVTIVAPNWTRRFRQDAFRIQFEQVATRELPAYIYPRFCYVDRDTMQKFEIAYKEWMIALAKCHPDECKINETVKVLIQLLEEDIYTASNCCNPENQMEPPC